MLTYLPELATLRQFADRIYWLFDTPKDYHQASCRLSVIVRDAAFRAVPELVKAMEQLSEEKFPKIMAYLKNPVSRRVRTNNHVERTNRMVRFLEKVRYKWRRRKTLVRFVVLRLDSIWSHWVAVRGQEGEITPKLPATNDASLNQTTTSSSRVRMRWCSARSVVFRASARFRALDAAGTLGRDDAHWSGGRAQQRPRTPDMA